MPARSPPPRGCLLLLALLAALPAEALQLREVRITGINGDPLDNVRGRLSLAQHAAESPLTEARLDYMLRRAPEEARRALEPFGYYDAVVEVQPRRTGDVVRVDIRIRPGEPVRVRERAITLRGAGARDEPLVELVLDFEPERGDVFDHRVYEESKRAIQRVLQQRGYFEAETRVARVEVTRAEHAADINLDFTTGPRAAFGEVRFSGSHIDEDVLQSRVHIEPGTPYDQVELLVMHQRLTQLDYFSIIEVQPVPAEASGVPPQVPIEVNLRPAPRTLYRAGVSYGTDNGAGIRLGFDRRYVNPRGHKITGELDLGQRRSAFATQYRVPGQRWSPGWWSYGVLAQRDERGAVETDLAGVLVSRSFELLDDPWSAEFHVQRERDRLTGNYTTLVFPALRWERKRIDDPLYPRSGYGLTAHTRAGHSAIGSQVDFVQVHSELRWAIGLGERNRILLRGEVGRTFGDTLEQLPPSLRFYAGGDRSVRGYGFQELGPRDDEGNVTGGRNLLVGSVEFEQMFTETWGAAVFVDAGNAFNGRNLDAAVGTGFGVRWRSPIGPVRLDLGFGLDDPDRSVRLHFTIGPQL